MLQPYAWRRQLWRMAFFYSPFVLVGWLIDHLVLCLLVATVVHLVWHYRFQKRLSDWLWHDRSLVPPHGSGSWEHIFNGIYKLQQRHRARRRELAGLIRRFREGAEALPDAAVVFRTDGSILWCYRLAEQLLGFRWPEDAGQHIGNLIRHPAFVAYLGKGQYDEPFEMHSPINEEKFLEFRIMPYAEDQAMLVVRDVTRLRSLEKTRKHFVSNVSHELRTPLTVLKGYLEMTEEPPPPAMWAKAHKVMMEQTIRMDNLVNQLLTLSRIEAAPTVDLSHLVDMPAMLGLLEQEARALSGERATRSSSWCSPICWCAAIRISCAAPSPTWSTTPSTTPRRGARSPWSGASRGAWRCLRCRMRGRGSPPSIWHGSPSGSIGSTRPARATPEGPGSALPSSSTP